MRDFDLLFFMRGSAWLLYRLAMWPFRAFLNDMRIRKAVRRFDAAMSNPFAPCHGCLVVCAIGALGL